MDKNNSEHALRRLWLAIRILGMDPPKNNYRTLYILYSILLNSVVTFYYPFSMFLNMFLLETKKEVVSNLTLTLCVIICSIKAFNILLKQKEIHQIRRHLKMLDASIDFPEGVDYFEYIVKISGQFFMIYTCIYGMVAATCEVPVMFATQQRLLYPAWFPWDWKESYTVYLLLHVYQFLGIYVQIYQNLLNDCFPGILLWLLKGHLHVLGLRVKKIGYDKRKTDEENYQELVKCIKYHRVCFEFHQLCENMLSSVMILQFIMTEITLCATGIYIFFVGENLYEVVYLSIYFVSMILEITLVSYSGSELLYESLRFTTALYECNWMEQNLKFRKVLLIFMQRSQKPWFTLAGGIVSITLSTWLSVLRSTYSLFAVLNQLA